jgi:CxxC-x17-CxxC domain-containing protein
MEFNDKTLICKDCGAEFIFTAGEQEFYAEKGFTNEPQRCKGCRAEKKAMRNGGPREQFETTCAECGAECRVPFKPNGEKPVYCSSCYEARR